MSTLPGLLLPALHRHSISCPSLNGHPRSGSCLNPGVAFDARNIEVQSWCESSWGKHIGWNWAEKLVYHIHHLDSYSQCVGWTLHFHHRCLSLCTAVVAPCHPIRCQQSGTTTCDSLWGIPRTRHGWLCSPQLCRHNSLAVGQPMPSQNLHHLILKGHYTDVACLFDQGLQLLLHMFFQHDLDTVTLCVRAWQEPCF